MRKQSAIREQYCKEHNISSSDLDHMLWIWKQQGKRTADASAEVRIYSEFATSQEALTRIQWAEIKASHNYECLRCHRREPDIELVADHVLPKSKGGPTTAANTQPLCRSCNAAKRDKHIDYR